jgi:type I restriction-modification system DNA methylase subunit
MANPRVTERTFYEPMIGIIRSKGGQGVQEVQYESVPDIVFKIRRRPWLLSVKIGDSPAIIKDAFLQYLRHKEDSKIDFGMVVFLPESFRNIMADETALQNALNQYNVTALIDAGEVKEELRDRPFTKVITFLIDEVMARLARKEKSYYSLKLVITLLQQQVTEMMQQIKMEEPVLLSIITDKNLLSDLGHLSKKHAESVAHFLGSYIFLSQVLFLRLLTAARPELIPVRTPATHNNLRRAFAKIREINYRPIYRFDVLDAINEKYLRDTFDLLWGLEIERIRFELPGRIFHELMPHEIRKMLASFYTRPHAADLLAQLTIEESGETVFDPACGSGTILTSAYRCKQELFTKEGKGGNPHKRFCENEIFGADIMPFAVHLTSANLSAMDAGTIIEKTQIIQGDSIRLRPAFYTTGITGHLFPETAKAQTREEEYYDVKLEMVNTVLMNPPFTKVERGIKKFVDMETFKPKCGGEVGLWGHFIMLADSFLKEDGTFGGVIPINLLRGRESKKVRDFIFSNWTPLYILKPTYNYGFSEWSEYRDILVIAKKQKPLDHYKVKFCLVKKDLTLLTDDDVKTIADLIKSKNEIRDHELVEIDTHEMAEIKERSMNMMWFCGVTDFGSRDKLVGFIDKLDGKLSRIPQYSDYFKTGFRADGGHSQFLFMTRETCPERVEQAFLRFKKDAKETLKATTSLGAEYEIPASCLMRSLRTPVGLDTFDISAKFDYVAKKKYPDLVRVCRAAGAKVQTELWSSLPAKLESIQTNLVVCRRINPFSPSQNLIAFFSSEDMAPSDQVNIISEVDPKKAKALCVTLNSIMFLSQFFSSKEESTGRYVDIRVYDLEEMSLIPLANLIKPLNSVFEKFSEKKFPSLRQQFDQNFDQRYEEFWEKQRGDNQGKLFSVLGKSIEPADVRVDFDLAVCKAIGLNMTKKDLMELYEIIVREMIIIKGLKRD